MCVHLQKSRPPPHLDFSIAQMTTNNRAYKICTVVLWYVATRIFDRRVNGLETKREDWLKSSLLVKCSVQPNHSVDTNSQSRRLNGRALA